VEASARALQEMLDVFFDYSHLDAQSTDVKLRPVSIDGMFEKLGLLFSNVAAEKGLRLRFRVSPTWVQSDPDLLLRILLNLVSNALQFTHRGGILVACRPTRGLTHVRIQIWDSGVGIAQQHHESIFEEFFQIENQQRDRAKGLGLGLSMVKRSCQLLNHPLTLHSSLGCGSRFTLIVPLASTQTGSTFKNTLVDTPRPVALESMHVLLIEDDALGADALKGLLESWGCRVTVASDAEMACGHLQRMPPPDFIVSDYRLPGVHSGIDAIRMLREASGLPIAACLISGDIEAEVRQRAVAAGLVLLRKPVQPAKLRSSLRHLVQANAPIGESSKAA
jgi:CheY-like chemotaxis protein